MNLYTHTHTLSVDVSTHIGSIMSDEIKIVEH